MHFRIADGTRNPQEVLAEQVQNYKRVFEQAMQQVWNLLTFLYISF